MKRLRDINWSQVAVDAVVIVASILIAFWIDASWNERNARQEEHTILSSLLTELREVQAARIANKDYLPAIRASLRRLLEFGRDPITTVTDDELDAWLSDTTWSSQELLVPAPILESLTAGDNIYRISNNELRLILVQLHKWIEVDRTTALRDLEFLDRQYNPYLNANSSVGQIYAADDGVPGMPSHNTTGLMEVEGRMPNLQVSHRDLIQNMEFQNLLIQRINLLTNLIGWGEWPEIDKWLAEAISAIEQELERG